jgi:outer membrane protein assembly factor BamE
MMAPSTLCVWRLLPLILLACLGGCALPTGLSSDTFKLYTPEVVQGNFVSREQRQALQSGMTRAQVRNMLGTPLVTSLFHADRWDYAFTIRRMGVPVQKFALTVHFKGDVLDRVDGDDLPSESEFVGRLARSAEESKLPQLRATEEQLARYPAQPQAPMPQAVSSAPLPTSYPPLEPAVR